MTVDEIKVRIKKGEAYLDKLQMSSDTNQERVNNCDCRCNECSRVCNPQIKQWLPVWLGLFDELEKGAE